MMAPCPNPRRAIPAILCLTAFAAYCGSPGPAEPGGQAVAEILPASSNLGPDDVSAAFELRNLGNAPLTWSFAGPPWVSASPASGKLPAGTSAPITMTPDRAKLTDGTHAATVTLGSNGGAAGVTLSVQVASAARIRLFPATVDFGATRSAFTISLYNDGGRPLEWSAAADAPWVRLSPLTGTVAPHSMRPLPLSVTRSALTGGEHETAVRFTSSGGAATLVVRLEVPGPPPPTGSIALEGRIQDQFTGAGVAGLQVAFAGSTAVTDGDGGFTVHAAPSSTLRTLEVSGGAIHSRRTFARSGDGVWDVIPAGFDLIAFNDIAREYEPRTIRWVQNPDLYIDTTPHNFTGGGSVPPEWIEEIEDAIAPVMAEWSDGTIQPGSVTVGSSPPAEGTPGTIVIQFDEDPERYPGAEAVGLARTFWSSGRAITSSRIWLRFSTLAGEGERRALFAHELGHTMGMGHMNRPIPSLMAPVVTVPGPTVFDHQAGEFMYRRSPGNSSPDTDDAATFVGILAPAGRVAGSYHWVCGDPALGSPETTPAIP